MYLYIDTSHQSTIGLLDQDYTWLEWIESDRKASFVQSEIAKLLEKRKNSFSQISKVYYSAGPGSYTGMRITEGFVGTLEAVGIESHGFYHFDLFNVLDIKDACWLSSAFKGEYFFYINQEKKLLSEDEAKEIVSKNQDKVYSYQGDKFFNIETKSSQSLLKKTPGVLKEMQGSKKPYYYRPLEKEFSVKKV